MARERIEFECPESFKRDIETHAENRGLSVAEYVRESLRLRMQKDIEHEEQG